MVFHGITSSSVHPAYYPVGTD